MNLECGNSQKADAFGGKNGNPKQSDPNRSEIDEDRQRGVLSKSSPRCATAETERTTTFLLRILTDEIERDGGACLVTTLKEYVIADYGFNELRVPLQVEPSPSKKGPSGCHKSSKRRNHQLNSLLSRSNVGKPKLLAFLESHSDVFCVDRSQIPHWVKLVVHHKRIVDGSPKLAENLRIRVLDKAYYVLRRRQARIERRRKTRFSMEDDCGVNCHWLLRQCSWEFHFFLRHSGFYTNPSLSGYHRPADVHQVGSKGWENIALQPFEKLLVSTMTMGKDHDSRKEQEGFSGASWIHVYNGKAYFRESVSSEEINRLVKSDKTAKLQDTCIEEEVGRENDEDRHEHYPGTDLLSDPMVETDDAGLELVRLIDRKLTEVVCEKDGGHQVALRLLLHRYPIIKELLGGRDLWKLYCDYSNLRDPRAAETDDCGPFFQNITMFYNGQHLVLRSKRPKATHHGETRTDDSKDSSYEEKRMKVDEEGLYSVTNNKWGRAMSNLVIQACRRVNLFNESASMAQIDSVKGGSEGADTFVRRSLGRDQIEKVIVDLTASVGGMTLALARSDYFDRVIALEIDKVRAGLCRDNMNHHGFHDETGPTSIDRTIVQVYHKDSVQQIPLLPRHACFVVDPPWGGYDYKEKLRREQVLKLGETPLQDVLVQMAHHNAPCVVGLRLPTNFVVQDFLTNLQEKGNPSGIRFECLTCRKISVQLFVVLYFTPCNLGESSVEANGLSKESFE